MSKLAFPPMQNANASQWNKGGVGSPTQNSCVGHVDFMFFVSISFALGSQREPRIQWNVGLRIEHGGLGMKHDALFKEL